jgi:TonB family protein
MENAMKHQKLLSLVAAVALLTCARSLAAEVKVIANLSVSADSISVAELKRVYLEQTRLLGDGSHVEPVLERSGVVNTTFLKDVLDINDDALQSYYRTLVFTGRGSMPRSLDSDAEVVAYVLKTRGAIGYVNATADVQGVKILPISAEGHQSQRTLLVRVEPEYPETLKRLSIGGTVRLSVTVSASGVVEKAEELGGNPILVASAITAVRQWVYSVGRSRTKMEVTIPFDPRQ